MSGSGKTMCVTGASVYIASWIVKLLLQRNYTVKASVRNPSDLKKIEHLVSLDGAEERLHLIKANLLEEGSFDAVVQGCECVFHTAYPFYHEVKDPQLWHVLSKTLAEDAAWKFAKETGIDMVCINLNPAMVIGPLLQPNLHTGAAAIFNLIIGPKIYPNFSFGWVKDEALQNLAEKLSETVDFAEAAASAAHTMDEQRRIVCAEVERLTRELEKQLESSSQKKRELEEKVLNLSQEKDQLIKQRDSRAMILEGAAVRAEENARVAEANAEARIKEAMEKESTVANEEHELLACLSMQVSRKQTSISRDTEKTGTKKTT